MLVFVKHPSGSTVTIKMDPDAKVIDMKEKFECEEGIKSSSQRMLFRGRELEDKYSLSDYKIDDDSTVVLHLKETDRMQVFVLDFDNKSHTIDIDKQDTVLALKNKI